MYVFSNVIICRLLFWWFLCVSAMNIQTRCHGAVKVGLMVQHPLVL